MTKGKCEKIRFQLYCWNSEKKEFVPKDKYPTLTSIADNSDGQLTYQQCSNIYHKKAKALCKWWKIKKI